MNKRAFVACLLYLAAMVGWLASVAAHGLQDPAIRDITATEIPRPEFRAGGPASFDPRPTVTSTDGWGIWSSLEGRTLDENLFQDIRVEGPRRHVWSSHNLSSRRTPLRLNNVLVYGNATWPGPLWALRVYNADPLIIEGCEFKRIGNFDGTFQFEGHAAYANLLGDFTCVDTYFHDSLGQAIQLVWRERETLIEDAPSGTIRLERLRVRDVSTHPDRGSYPISIFNPGQEVQVNRVTIWSTRAGTPEWHNTRTGDTNRSRGGFGIFWGEGGVTTPKATIRRLNVLLIDPDRASVKFAGVGEIDWHGGLIKNEGNLGRRARIEVDGCPTGSITGLTGDFEIRLDGVTVAVNEDFSW